MAQKKKRKKTIDTWKTKKWFKVKAPKILDSKDIGEVVANDPEKLLGRTIKTTMREVTGTISQQHIKVRLKINDVKGQTATTKIIGHELQKSYWGRQSRRMKTNVAYIGPVTTKDKVRAQVTIKALSRGETKAAQKKAIRAILKQVVEENAKKLSFDKLFHEMVFGKISAEAAKKCKKIYPLSRVEVLKTRVITEGERVEEEAPKKPVKEKKKVEEPIKEETVEEVEPKEEEKKVEETVKEEAPKEEPEKVEEKEEKND